MTRGHNIISEGWAGASNPHPHLKPHCIHAIFNIFPPPSRLLGVAFTDSSHLYYPTDNFAPFDLGTGFSSTIRFFVIVDTRSDAVNLLFHFGDGNSKLVSVREDLDFGKVCFGVDVCV